jgi:hypothetical protein
MWWSSPVQQRHEKMVEGMGCMAISAAPSLYAASPHYYQAETSPA